ncbi:MULTISPECIES: TetR/AcrR family transcriptional regulator [Paenibacillus]|uniref:TetR/AcrR family transcriptional regulator n=1 Tax=Paenibacillus TaxID=44249 RepID=UPI0022B8F7A5|nr:TetR/AcrR family transcriptional regulator [Paenibacillus caseinilyticus]MCZ8523532.1 TetR/AcrR family transcriptional regulator [Paenibacillus caseinilyticus]
MSVTSLKQAALRLFAAGGYDAVPLSGIAKETGIKTPSIYSHFKSKDDLFLAVFDDCLLEHTLRMRALMERLGGLTVEDQLFTVLRDASRTYLLSDEGMTFLKRTMLFPPLSLQETLRERFSAAEGEMHDLLVRLFKQGMEEGLVRREAPEDLVASFYCLLDGSFLQQYYYQPGEYEQRLDAVWRIYWKGISTPKE